MCWVWPVLAGWERGGGEINWAVLQVRDTRQYSWSGRGVGGAYCCQVLASFFRGRKNVPTFFAFFTFSLYLLWFLRFILFWLTADFCFASMRNNRKTHFFVRSETRNCSHFPRYQIKGIAPSSRPLSNADCRSSGIVVFVPCCRVSVFNFLQLICFSKIILDNLAVISVTLLPPSFASLPLDVSPSVLHPLPPLLTVL